MKTMDLEKTDKTMQAFEKTFEELDVLTSVSICYPLYNQKALFHWFVELGMKSDRIYALQTD